MLQYVTGDLLQSDADALVNTVNCEGYMGKGIAYQFKLQFPDTNADYVRACRRGEVRPGQLHIFRERGKIVINFPTKDNWREKSKLEYIESGLDDLLRKVPALGIQSIAIPPLGSGNGGLVWSEVRGLIERKLNGMSDLVDIFLYEPSKGNSNKPQREPKLSTSALILMEMKENLHRFNALRLQKTAYFTNVVASEEYFVFKAHKYGPYAHSIDIVSRRIREFQNYHETTTTQEAFRILLSELISSNVQRTLDRLTPGIHFACQFVNSIDTDHELECLSTVCYIVSQQGPILEHDIVRAFSEWSSRKSRIFSESEIRTSLEKLCDAGFVEHGLVGYQINRMMPQLNSAQSESRSPITRR